jgi:hypothetical protein
VIGNLGRLIEGCWHWELIWRRTLFAWEEDQYREFLDIITLFSPTVQQDRWLWLGDDLQGFTVNSAYLLLVVEYNPPVVRDAIGFSV